MWLWLGILEYLGLIYVGTCFGILRKVGVFYGTLWCIGYVVVCCCTLRFSWICLAMFGCVLDMF